MRWTVATCKNDNCTYQQQVRAITIDVEKPHLVSPVNGATLNQRRPTFKWTKVSWADHYLVCVSKPGVACPDHEVPVGTNPDTMVIKTTGTSKGLDLYQFRGTTRHWTVAACRQRSWPYPVYSGYYCSKYQPQVRSITVDPTWNVSVRLSHIDVHDDCDNITSGDWRLKYVLVSSNFQFEETEWPRANRGSRDVDTGQRVQIGKTLGVSNMRETDNIYFGVSVVDCDSDGIWTLANVFNGVRGVVDTVINWIQTCGGEEFSEMSGGNDNVGIVYRRLNPQDWISRRNVPIVITSSGGMDCGSRPYTAHFVLTSQPN